MPKTQARGFGRESLVSYRMPSMATSKLQNNEPSKPAAAEAIGVLSQAATVKDRIDPWSVYGGNIVAACQATNNEAAKVLRTHYRQTPTQLETTDEEANPTHPEEDHKRRQKASSRLTAWQSRERKRIEIEVLQERQGQLRQQNLALRQSNTTLSMVIREIKSSQHIINRMIATPKNLEDVGKQVGSQHVQKSMDRTSLDNETDVRRRLSSSREVEAAASLRPSDILQSLCGSGQNQFAPIVPSAADVTRKLAFLSSHSSGNFSVETLQNASLESEFGSIQQFAPNHTRGAFHLPYASRHNIANAGQRYTTGNHDMSILGHLATCQTNRSMVVPNTTFAPLSRYPSYSLSQRSQLLTAPPQGRSKVLPLAQYDNTANSSFGFRDRAQPVNPVNSVARGMANNHASGRLVSKVPAELSDLLLYPSNLNEEGKIDIPLFRAFQRKKGIDSQPKGSLTLPAGSVAKRSSSPDGQDGLTNKRVKFGANAKDSV